MTFLDRLNWGKRKIFYGILIKQNTIKHLCIPICKQFQLVVEKNVDNVVVAAYLSVSVVNY